MHNGPPTPDTETYLTVLEVATQLRVSKMTVYRLIHTGELPASQFGKTMRVAKADLAAFKKAARLVVTS